ncbi:thioesterase II family protein [Myceligenerans crystallogenes]|uniref:Surfactin biosynthesis thioesterase SrfAD n=1 Tax=Myceligenerans crystallogenes TaxID=316335 RepID=A0ABN2N2S6_9MICO
MSSDVLWHLRESAGRQIVMFPFLGGFGASFNRLIGRLDGDWDVWTVNPPGHGTSVLPAVTRLDELVDLYLRELRDVLRPGAVFFGHSMGAVVGYHTLLAMTGRPEFDGRRPADLVLSASAGPRELPVVGLAGLPEPELMAHLRSFGTFPEEVLRDRSIMELFLPAFRADYEVLEEIRRRPVTRLDVSAHLILGERDTQTPAGTPQVWQEYLVRPLRYHHLDRAEHMFVLDEPERVVPVLDDLNRVTAGAL